MTNNIIIHFANQKDKRGRFIDYHVVAGSVFNEEYNETLDSATIVLSQIPSSKRLTNVERYDYVHVFDASGNTNFSKLFLVDTYSEKENNIKKHLFGYTINLMSETKLLEKFQCPNLVITHDVKEGETTKKTIFQHILRYMNLYIPKIKFTEDGESWSYKPLIKIPGIDDELHEATLGVNFNDDNFEYYTGHGTSFYNFECYSDPLPENIDYDSIEIVSVNLDDDVAWIGEVICDFNNDTGIFHMTGMSNNVYYGTNTITYKYKNLFATTDFFKRFDVPCADLSFNCPTLRQLLTTLMQQVGCIPIVKNRTLGFLDLQKEAVCFGGESKDYYLNNTVNYITRNSSSDSYVNTLVNISENVLDSGNEVICEVLGFRDRSNMLLKQKENLCLETSLPIYKVNKCILHGPGKCAGALSSSYNCFLGTASYQGTWVFSPLWPVIFYKEATISNNTATIIFRCSSNILSLYDSFTIKVDYIYFWVLDSETGSYKIVETKPFKTSTNQYFVMSNSNTENRDCNYFDQGYSTVRTLTSKALVVNIPFSNSSVAGFFISGSFVNNNNNQTRKFTFIKFADNDTNVTYHDPYLYNSSNDPTDNDYVGHYWSNDTSVVPTVNRFMAAYGLSRLIGFQSWDISSLVVENSVRQLLSSDFNAMYDEIQDASSATIEKISKYVYGTVGYSIGSKTISGFSEVYIDGDHTPLGWVQKEYTYLENILNAFQSSGFSSTYLTFDIISAHFEGLDQSNLQRGRTDSYTHNGNNAAAFQYMNVVNYSFVYYNPITDSFDTNGIRNFTDFFVDLYYQPLNSFNLAYVKSDKDAPIPLEQYDGNASGLTDFDRLSIHEQEQADRIGNETLSISQRTTDFNQIKNFDDGPLYYEDDTDRNGSITSGDKGIRYIIFKRSFSINNNCFNVSYVGSEDAVIKNYFTSIRTKYRAYQYVDYSQSVLRKERDTLYVRIASDYYNGDDKIRFGPLESMSVYSARKYLANFIYDFSNDAEQLGYQKNISYEVEKGLGKLYAMKMIDGQETAYIKKERQTVKNSVSAVTTKNMMAFIYEYMDNVGAGPYITRVKEDTTHLGGVPQTWQIWSEDYNDKHTVSFVSSIDFYTESNTVLAQDPEADMAEQVSKICKTPIVDGYDYTTIFSVVKDNSNYTSAASEDSYKRVFYKDYAERINHTVQFIYYAPNKDVLFGEDFVSGAPVINRFLNTFNRVVVSNSDNCFYFDDNPHSLKSGEAVGSSSVIEFITDASNGIPKIRIMSNFKVVKACHYDESTGLYTDIVVFKKESTSTAYTDYFITINDTKTDKVFADEEGMACLSYEVNKYTAENEYTISRTCNDLYERLERLEYIETSGSQYIQVDYKVHSQNVSIKTKIYVSNMSSSSEYIFSTFRTGSEQYLSLYLRNGYFHGANVISSASFTAPNMFEIELNVDNPNSRRELKINNITYIRQTPYTFREGNDTTILGLSRATTSNRFNGRIYYLQVYEDGKLKLDLIPVKTSRGVVCFYDKITDNLYENLGSGAFVPGPIIDEEE